MIIQILQIIAAAATILTGLFSMLKPTAITGFTGLSSLSGRGITEIRAIFGGLFIALGLFPLLAGSPIAYTMLGVSYLGIGSVRAISMFIDKSLVTSNWVSLTVEVIFGIILVI
ncbi:MAG: DUF4345 domain-containing protein [Chloroflexi bacterium]|nr:DUF4345 domain-containing protein [Chloroflexota bacterium]